MEHHVHLSKPAITQMLLNGFEAFVIKHDGQRRSGIELHASLYGTVKKEKKNLHHHIEFISVDTTADMNGGYVAFNQEAQYLKDRLLLSCTESLLAYLVENTQPIDDTVHFPWFHSSIGTFPSRLQNWLIHARNFSETIHGAALLYNLKLAELAKNEELVSQYHENMEQWYARLRIRQEAWPQWNRIEFWALAARPGVNVPTLSRKFVDEWLDRLFINGKISL